MKIGKKTKHDFEEVHSKQIKDNYLSQLKAYRVLLDLLQGTCNCPDPGWQFIATIIKKQNIKQTTTKTHNDLQLLTLKSTEID